MQGGCLLLRFTRLMAGSDQAVLPLAALAASMNSPVTLLPDYAWCVPLEQHHPLSDLKTWQYKSQIRSLQDPVQKLRPGP